MKAIKLVFIVIGCCLPLNYALAATTDLTGMFQKVASNVGPLSKLIVAISYVMGIWFISDSVYRLKKYGQARTMMSTSSSLAKPVILMAIGLAMLYFPTFVNLSLQSIWVNSGSKSVLKYPSEPSMWDAFIHPMIDVIRLFGLIALVRGLAILTKIASESTQPGVVGKGVMHIIAGTLAINIVGTINMIKSTFGF